MRRQVTLRQGDKEFREFKTYVCQHRILKNPEEARMAGNVLNSLNSLNSLNYQSARLALASILFSVLSSRAGKKSIPVSASISSTLCTHSRIGCFFPTLLYINSMTLGLPCRQSTTLNSLSGTLHPVAPDGLLFAILIAPLFLLSVRLFFVRLSVCCSYQTAVRTMSMPPVFPCPVAA